MAGVWCASVWCAGVCCAGVGVSQNRKAGRCRNVVSQRRRSAAAAVWDGRGRAAAWRQCARSKMATDWPCASPPPRRPAMYVGSCIRAPSPVSSAALPAHRAAAGLRQGQRRQPPRAPALHHGGRLTPSVNGSLLVGEVVLIPYRTARVQLGSNQALALRREQRRRHRRGRWR